ncbi:MAG: hypothetical protein ACRD0U_11585 [Acidimicrobiales bacterium]
MKPLAKLTLFALVLLALFGAGIAVGALAGPFDQDQPPSHVEHAP